MYAAVRPIVNDVAVPRFPLMDSATVPRQPMAHGRRLRWRAQSSRALNLAAWTVLCAVVGWTYVWLATGGTYRFNSSTVPYHELLADAFLAGQLHLLIQPSPELLALENPYDELQSAPYSFSGASYYQGRYYLYFGPVPGLIHAGWKYVFGWSAEESAVQLLSTGGGAFMFLLLARRLRDIAFPGLSDYWVAVVASCYAFGGVNLYLLARVLGHHETLTVAGFFVVSGLYFWLRGLEGRRMANMHLLLGGILLGCAFASRHNMIGFPLVCGLVMVARWLPRRHEWRSAGPVLAYGIGPLAIVFLHMAYNYARFGSPFDVGVNYVLTGVPLNLDSNVLGVVSFSYALSNLYTYTLLSPEWSPFFPFFRSVPPTRLPGWFFDAPILPVPLVAPLVLFAPFSVMLLRNVRWRENVVAWFILGVAGGLIIPTATTIFNIAAIGRYLQDTLPAATALGVLGLWWLRAVVRRSMGRVIVGIGGAVLLVLSIVMGGALGMAELVYERSEAFARLAFGFDRVVVPLARSVSPSGWLESYGSIREMRPYGPFYVAGEPYNLPVAPGTVVQSVRIASGYPGRTELVLDVNGRTVLREFIYPGEQVFTLDEGVETGPLGYVAVRPHLPEQPPGPVGSVQPIAVYRPIPRAEFAIADSYRVILEDLRRQVETLTAQEQQMRADANVTIQGLEASLKEAESSGSQREIEARRHALVERRAAISRDLSTVDEAVRAATARFHEENARVDALRAKTAERR